MLEYLDMQGDTKVWENMDKGTLTKTKKMLDDLHKRKTDVADEIFVITVDTYIGRSIKKKKTWKKKNFYHQYI
jgi:hypothetical protein